MVEELLKQHWKLIRGLPFNHGHLQRCEVCMKKQERRFNRALKKLNKELWLKNNG